MWMFTVERKGRYPPNSQKIANGRDLRVLLHSRNIRAVLFHPDGDYIFAAAPDAPRQSTPAFTPCRLYAFTFDDIGNRLFASHLITLSIYIYIYIYIYMYMHVHM